MPRGTKLGIAFLCLCVLASGTLFAVLLTIKNGHSEEDNMPKDRVELKREAKNEDAITVDRVLSDYEDNAVAAIKKYDSKDITVGGKVERIEQRGTWAFVYLYPSGKRVFRWAVCSPYILCKFSSKDAVVDLKRGDSMCASGYCYGQPDNNPGREIILNDCKLK